MKFTIASAIAAVIANASSIVEAGNWPDFMRNERSIKGSLEGRIPVNGETGPGFDAGVAAAMGLVPEHAIPLIATLHAAYTPAAVEQVRREAVLMDPESPTTYWLAACSLCKEGKVDEHTFLQQVEAFQELLGNPVARVDAAVAEFAAMKAKFSVIDEVAFTSEDGGMQGAYVAGHRWAVQAAGNYGIFFIGTFEPSLGLEEFAFSDRKDGQGRPMSGPVWGSKQFIKVSSFDELAAAIKVVRAKLGSAKTQ